MESMVLSVVLSDKEILEIAQQINPEIKNINEIKKNVTKMKDKMLAMA